MATLAMDEDNFDEVPSSSLPVVPPNDDLWGELLRTKSIGAEQSPNNINEKTELRKNERYIIGRDAKQAHIYINDLHVSSKHCILFRDDNQQVWIEDHSLSGTFVNGNRVTKNAKRRLTNGDTITLLHASAASATATPQSKQRSAANFYEFVFRDLTPKQGPCKGAINLKYEVMEEIGSGSFATVRKGVNRTTQEEVAIKIVLRKQFEFEPSKWKDQLKEIDMLKRVNHDGCVRLLDCYEVDEALYIVMEYVRGGELFDRILNNGKLAEPEARVLVRRLLEAVHYLHMQGIVHRDLKPENILCVHQQATCYHIKVADFGVARLVENGCRTVTGSLAYLAPEVFDRRDTVRGVGSYAYEVDMWSVGVIVYVCLLAKLPFHDMEGSGDLNQAVKRMFAGNELVSLSEEAKDFLGGLLTMDASKRFSASKALEHPWVADSTHCAKLETCGLPENEQCPVCVAEKKGDSSAKRIKLAASASQQPPVPLFSQD